MAPDVIQGEGRTGMGKYTSGSFRWQLKLKATSGVIAVAESRDQLQLLAAPYGARTNPIQRFQ